MAARRALCRTRTDFVAPFDPVLPVFSPQGWLSTCMADALACTNKLRECTGSGAFLSGALRRAALRPPDEPAWPPQAGEKFIPDVQRSSRWNAGRCSKQKQNAIISQRWEE